jgi:zinc/manganese transport system substrate-binding protein
MAPRALLGLLAAALVLPACGSPATPAGGTAPSAGGAPATIPVVASTDVYGAVVRAVGGDRVTVTSLIDDPAADPHSFEAPPAAAAAVADARVVVLNGGGYDDFADQLLASAGSDATTIRVVDLAPPAAAGEEPNEHVWYSLPAVKALAERLATDLGVADPAAAATFTANATAFDARVDGLVAKVEALRTAHGGERIAVTEPVPLLLTGEAGLVNVTPDEFTEAVEEDVDPPAAVVAQTLGLFAADPVRVLLVNGQTRTPVTDQVEQAARTAGVPVVEVGETLPSGVDDYATWMNGQLDALTAALGRP